MLVRQREDYDCVIASLAMFLEKPYEEIRKEIAQDTIPVSGVYIQQMQRIALKHGVDLRQQKELRIPKEKSILVVVNNSRPLIGYHAVYFDGQQIYDPLQDAPKGLHEVIIAQTYAISPGICYLAGWERSWLKLKHWFRSFRG